MSVGYSSSADVRRSRGSLLPLSTLGALVVATAGGLIGAAADTAFSVEVRDFFAAGFSIGTAVALWSVRREDQLRTLVWIPLIYVAILLFAGVVHHPGTTYLDWLVLAFVFKAPVIFITAGVGVATLLVRRLAGR